MSIIKETPKNKFVPPPCWKYEERNLEHWNKQDDVAMIELGVTRIRTSAFEETKIKEVQFPNSLRKSSHMLFRIALNFRRWFLEQAW